jgi:hypothetical protein
MRKYLSKSDLLIIAVTIILFSVALFLKGFTKELLLEGGVLLVSIKLIMMNYKTSIRNKEILKELTIIKNMLTEFEETKSENNIECKSSLPRL